MGQLYTFHKTVRGHIHIKNDIPCEDASSSFNENGRYQIAIIADGHGSKACFRSSYGSQAAVNVTLDCLKEFASTVLESSETEQRFYRDILSNPRYRAMSVRQLTDTIISRWNQCVMENFKNCPPSEEEMGEFASIYADENRRSHIYGTTLMAALMLRECLLLIHQGDGRCEVFYADGYVEQPVPWDNRCQDTTTTSLCDEDASDSIRSCVIDLKQHPVMACYLGCDGVEDGYRDTYEALGGSHVLMGGVHTFYKYLSRQITLLGTDDFEAFLNEMLPDFSANGRFSKSGSGDDVSVAGIVDLDMIGKYSRQYDADIKRYGLEEELFLKEDELRGKTRKHGILQNRLKEAQDEFYKEQKSVKEYEVKLQKINEKRKLLSMQIQKEKKELADYQSDSNSVKSNLEATYKRFAAAAQHFLEEISAGYQEKELSYSRKAEHLNQLDQLADQIEAELGQRRANLFSCEQKFKLAQRNFEEYDMKYRAIDAQRLEIVEKIKLLDLDYRQKDSEIGTELKKNSSQEKELIDSTEQEYFQNENKAEILQQDVTQPSSGKDEADSIETKDDIAE